MFKGNETNILEEEVLEDWNNLFSDLPHSPLLTGTSFQITGCMKRVALSGFFLTVLITITLTIEYLSSGRYSLMIITIKISSTTSSTY